MELEGGGEIRAGGGGRARNGELEYCFNKRIFKRGGRVQNIGHIVVSIRLKGKRPMRQIVFEVFIIFDFKFMQSVYIFNERSRVKVRLRFW